MSNKPIKISIITVCYNSGKTIRKTIESVLSQEYTNIEYIIIDGKSTDRTLDIVNEYKDAIAQIISEPDDGIYDAMNKGIRNCSGDYIAIINSDDYFYNEHVMEEFVKEAEQKGSDIIYGDLFHIDDVSLKYISNKYITVGEIRRGANICPQCMLFKRDIYYKIGFFNTKYKLAADFEWLLRAIATKIKISYIEKPICYFSLSGVSTLKNEMVLKEIYDIVCLEIGEQDKDFYENMKYEYALSQMTKYDICEYARNICRLVNDRDLYLYGAGNHLKRAVDVCQRAEINVLGIIDQNRKNSVLQNFRVFHSIDKIEKSSCVFITSTRYYDEMAEILRGKKKHEVQDFFGWKHILV